MLSNLLIRLNYYFYNLKSIKTKGHVEIIKENEKINTFSICDYE